MKKLRQSIVEPVLGTLINCMGARRVWTKELKGANKFMLEAAIAYNLKKGLNNQEQKVKNSSKYAKNLLATASFHIYRYTAYLSSTETAKKI